MVASPGFVTRNVPDDRRLFRCYPFYFIQKVAIVNALSYANADGLTVSLSHEQVENAEILENLGFISEPNHYTDPGLKIKRQCFY